MPVRIAVVYYSATGNVYEIAEAIAQGARDAQAEVRLLRAAELAPNSAIDANPKWREHLNANKDIPVVTPEDMRWADGLAFGSPTRFGNISSQLKQFIDTTTGPWQNGDFVDKPFTGFTSSHELHGGQETTLTSLYNVACHWGCVVLPTGYADFDIIHAAGGNPYGISRVEEDNPVKNEDLISASRFQGARLARVAGALATLRSAA
jgi:NAD(P)H dehydrogenase (quinone)